MAGGTTEWLVVLDQERVGHAVEAPGAVIGPPPLVQVDCA